MVCDKQTREKRPRESILRTEFRNAIDLINKDLPEENRLKFLHLDLNKISRRYTGIPSYCPLKLEAFDSLPFLLYSMCAINVNIPRILQ